MRARGDRYPTILQHAKHWSGNSGPAFGALFALATVFSESQAGLVVHPCSQIEAAQNLSDLANKTSREIEKPTTEPLSFTRNIHARPVPVPSDQEIAQWRSVEVPTKAHVEGSFSSNKILTDGVAKEDVLGRKISVQAYPLSVLEGTTFKRADDPFAVFGVKGFSRWRFGVYRALVVNTIETEHFFLVSFFTEILDGEPAGFFDALQEQGVRLDVVANSDRQPGKWDQIVSDSGVDIANRKIRAAEAELVKHGLSVHKELLEETLKFFESQARRRKWYNPQEIKEQAELVEKSKLNSRFLLVREKLKNRMPGRIVASAGFATSEYGAIEIHNLVTNQREVRYGPFGPLFANRHFDARFSPRSIPPPRLWAERSVHSQIEILPVEEYSGHSFDRPFVPYGPDPRQVAQMMASRYSSEDFPEDVRPDFTQPIRLGFGIVEEVIKVAVLPPQELGSLRKEAQSEIQMEFVFAAFHSGVPLLFSKDGKAFFSRNDLVGVKLFAPYGLEVLPHYSPVSKNSSNWLFVGTSTVNAFKKLKKLLQPSDEKAARYLEDLDQAINGTPDGK